MSKNLHPNRSRYIMPISLFVLGVSAMGGYIIYSTDFKINGSATPWSKFVFAIRWQVLSCTTLVFSVMRVGFARVSKDAMDPLDHVGQKRLEPLTRRLQNTLEQLILNVIAQLVLSTFLEPDKLWVIPFLVLLFVTGRILFFLGYPDQRTLGFLLTYLPTVATILADISFLITSGPVFKL